MGVEPCARVGWFASRISDLVATVVIAEPAVAQLDELNRRLDLPGTTRARVKSSLEGLATFPLLGRALAGRWQGFRFVLGPWPWMLLIYEFDEVGNQVGIVTIQDSRSAQAATTEE
jgi:hypothetical protein